MSGFNRRVYGNGFLFFMVLSILTVSLAQGAGTPSGKAKEGTDKKNLPAGVICDGPGPCILPQAGKTADPNTGFGDRNGIAPTHPAVKPRIDVKKEPWFIESANLPMNHPALSRERMVWAESFLWVPMSEILAEIPVEQWLTFPPGDMAGKYVLIEVWASWCPPCRRSLPYLNFIQEKYKDELVVIAICETDEEDIRSMPGELKVEDVKFSLAIDTGRRLANRLKVFGIPHAVLLEPMLGGVVWEGMPTLPRYELTDKVLEKYFAIGKKLREMGKLPKVSPIKFVKKEATAEDRATRRKDKKKDVEGEGGGPSIAQPSAKQG